MPRNASGVYSLPIAPFVPNTPILSASANSDLSDIATALTQSLATTGVSAMTGPILAASGTVSSPAYAFASEVGTGFYLASSGTTVYAVAGTGHISFSASALTLLDTNLVLSTGNITVTLGDITAAAGNFIDNTGKALHAIPVGGMMDFAGTVAPSLWLLCNNQAVSRTTYAALFAVTGTTFGVGNGTTTFNVPDFRGRVAAGDDTMGGSAANRLSAASTGGCAGTIGSGGGEQSHTMTQAELVAHTHVMVTGGGAFVVTNTGGLVALDSPGAFGAGGVNTTQSTGSTTAFNDVQPTLVCYKIIYAGV